MLSIDAKLIEARQEFEVYGQTQMGYTNPQTVNECLNGPGVDRLPT